MELNLLSGPGGATRRRVEARRIFCIGMNYVEHIEELNSKRPSAPVVFMKPRESLVPSGERVPFPTQGENLHNETEFVLMIGKEGQPQREAEALSMVQGVGLGFDLTLRDVQNRLKTAGHPWEASKAFESSALISDFVETGDGFDLDNVEFFGRINGEAKQLGNTKDMIFSSATLILFLSSIWKLREGDLIYTGTPPGVGSLKRGDRLEASSPWIGHFTWQMEDQ